MLVRNEDRVDVVAVEANERSRRVISLAESPASTSTCVFSVEMSTQLPVEPLPRTVNLMCYPDTAVPMPGPSIL